MATSVTYPSTMCYVFNPIYIEIESEESTAVVEASCDGVSRSITVYMHNGSCSVYISKMLQLFFSDIPNVRSLNIGITVDGENDKKLTCIWGSVGPLDRYIGVGVMSVDRDGNPVFRRRTRMFTKFPSKHTVMLQGISKTVELYWRNASSVENEIKSPSSIGLYDLDGSDVYKEGYTRVKVTTEIDRLNGSSLAVFNAAFDFSFPDVSKVVYDVLTIDYCDDTDGVYLRWVDHYGFWQYFLFSAGDKERKNDVDDNSVRSDMTFNGVMFGMERPMSVTFKDTLTLCATSLDELTLATVETISTAAYIDMYMGKDTKGNDIWIPVTIGGTTNKTSSDEVLQDYEFSITLPSATSQTL